ncbi:hypothetical protein GCM10017044_00340 [Kordiimonas sediminis]|uniref:DUF2927 domain-containing protein n=1 Tax=Kordiimonas sediminis TaxID=1735581 RepID=A0A919AIL7_9PROT|nr:hypothetical protein [Kordiimonas sediminis]GHF10589.1 hypothetical protein GCM10017044_00340 [Kordiimonas sediminis]
MASPTALMKTLTASILFAGTMTIMSNGVAASPAPDHPQSGYGRYYDEYYRPLTVYIDFDGPQRERREERIERRLVDAIQRRLDRPVRFTDSRRRADMIIKARELDYDLSFRITDVDRKDKSYDNRYRYGHGRCGNLYKAYYDRIEEKGTAYYRYQLSVRLKGEMRFKDEFRGRAREDFKYGRNLRAATNCGIRPTDIYPSSKVARLFEKASPGYRHTVAREIRRETLDDLGRQIARIINRTTKQIADASW